MTVRDRVLDQQGDDDLAAAFAGARVHSPYERETGIDMLGVVRYEERVLDDPERGGSVLYDGVAAAGAEQAAPRRRSGVVDASYGSPRQGGRDAG